MLVDSGDRAEVRVTFVIPTPQCNNTVTGKQKQSWKMLNRKSPFRYTITKSLELVSNDKLIVQERKGKLPQITMSEIRPLLVLLAWLGSKPAHVIKYADFYLDKGFDVLLVTTSPWQVISPLTGFLATSSCLADFLNEHQNFQTVLIHGLSIGCGVWSYTEEKMLKNPEKYQNTIERLAGYICDSPPIGSKAKQLSYLMFNKDSILRIIAEKIIILVLQFTYFFSYKYFLHGNQLIYYPSLKLPRVLLFSQDDPISDYNDNLKLIEVWKSEGIQVNFKLWRKSVHVSHFIFHKEEYIDQINMFLKSIGLADISKNTNKSHND